MGFNRNDLDNDDDDFNFEDDSGFDFGDEGGDEFKFDDEPEDVGLDSGDSGFGFEEEDMPDIDEEEEAGGGGVSRTFIIIAGVMILLFVLGLAAVLLIGLGGGGPPSEFEQTRVAIETLNANTQLDAFATATAKAIQAATDTVLSLTPLATATLPPTETPQQPATFTPTPTLDPTQLAAIAFQTQQAFDLTQTAQFLLTPPSPTPGTGAEDVALTATALAMLLAPQQTQEVAGVPTQEIGAPIPTALPQTGFFDDLAAGNANVGMIALMGLGLVGVILVSRRVRTANK
jgi:hypothetical protein